VQPRAAPSTGVPPGDTITIDEALHEHEGLVHTVIRRHGSGVLTYEEALHAGRIGLWRALLRCDATEGPPFRPMPG